MDVSESRTYKNHSVSIDESADDICICPKCKGKNAFYCDCTSGSEPYGMYHVDEYICLDCNIVFYIRFKAIDILWNEELKNEVIGF